MFFVLISLLLCVPPAIAGDLDSLRNEVRGSEIRNAGGSVPAASSTESADNNPEKKSKRNPSYCDDFDDEEGFFESIFSDMFSATLSAGVVGVGVAATSPYWVPRNWIEQRSNAITYLRPDPHESVPYGFR
ncbi:MAG: hypothetical protein KDB00_11345 [Planctomycetales bacterium]|nr:hypothetical protein [Planctomycetales bacterium]